MKKIVLILSTSALTAMILMSSIHASHDVDTLSSDNSFLLNRVTIGSQVWMAENLNVDKFRNGDPIPQVTTEEAWKLASKEGQPAWCYYNNDPSNEKKYGKLYNWYAVIDSRGLAPAGWHIPSDDEWTQLTNFLGEADKVGTKLKSTSGWKDDRNGTNSTGFSGLPGGSRSPNGKFNYLGSYGYWWSSSEFTPNIAWHRYLPYINDGIKRGSSYEGFGMSIRCVKN